ncbi:2497_t:CDS:2 [Funneliformis mosseae]|uniref:2497_t:CDS:1 n=1 Tax=Funneliformis mosseae TaxID=27381 RepID=A0A9N8V5E6_FUNMO|nr:2497_t:CDS:2 [Funneliformis mosseae]
MSFRSMATGAECSVGSNPLSQIMKQITDERSLQKDTFVPSTERVGPSSFRTARPDVSSQENKFTEDFFNQQEHEHLRLQGHIPTSIPGFVTSEQEWATEFNNRSDHSQLWKLGPAEETEMEEAFKRMNVHTKWNHEFLHGQDFSVNQVTEIPPEFEEVFQKNFDWASEYVLKQDKGKGKEKIVELDHLSWEEQFAAAQREAEGENIDDELIKEFENVWSKSNIRGQLDDDEYIDPKNWESNLMNRFANLGEYTFEHNNPYIEHENPFQEGLRLTEEGGSLSEAALAFEAAVQKDGNKSDAWMWLGNTQAQNEKEEAAIRALQKAVEVDGNNLTALMSLAVSYTNEGYDNQAYLTLERWITAKYPDIAVSNAPMHGMNIHSRVTDLFLQAARSAPEGQEMDSDVQVGLGVLFYGSCDYEKAVDCFVAALNTRKEDYLLWNRLGATLANSGRPEDAIEAYHKALDFKPTFVRARYNLGVSCLNIGCYSEAAEHLLGALSMHQTGLNSDGGVNTSNSLRETLHRTFLMMERQDLAEKILSGADVDQFREEFEF